MTKKPDIDPVTGCAHIKNCKGYKPYRACSACGAQMFDDFEIDELEVNYCWKCGAMFDHNDDDEAVEELQ